MAEMVWCPVSEIASVLEKHARAWRLVAVVKSQRLVQRGDVDQGDMRLGQEDGRELYFEHDLE